MSDSQATDTPTSTCLRCGEHRLVRISVRPRNNGTTIWTYTCGKCHWEWQVEDLNAPPPH